MVGAEEGDVVVGAEEGDVVVRVEEGEVWAPYLQWTTMGPASEGLQALTRRRKASVGVGYSGTPWSGQAMNWNCLTSLFSLEPF